jgi:hypothetical protein
VPGELGGRDGRQAAALLLLEDRQGGASEVKAAVRVERKGLRPLVCGNVADEVDRVTGPAA